MSTEAYEAVGNELVKRIKALIPTHPEIKTMRDPWGLFDIEEFKCTDLSPSLAQASWALSKAQKES